MSLTPDYQRDGVTLYMGDCLDVLPTLAAGSAALTVTSPPYCLGKSYEADCLHGDWAAMIWAAVAGLAPVTTSGGFVAINLGDVLCYRDPALPRIRAAKPRLALTEADVRRAMAAHQTEDRHKLAALLGVSEQTVDRRIKGNNARGGKAEPQSRVLLTGGIIEGAGLAAGLPLYDRRVWVKDPCWANCQWHSNSYRAVDESESIYVLWKPGPTAVDRGRIGAAEWAEWGSRQVWRIPSVRVNDSHPAMFPVELPRRLVRLLSPPQARVLDPFMGSGTTGVACVRTGRRFIGVEIKPEYFDIAVRRIDAELRQGRLPLAGSALADKAAELPFDHNAAHGRRTHKGDAE